VSRSFDIARVRGDFPALAQRMRGRPLVYLDSAATSLKPEPVIDAVIRTYVRDCSNVHRGIHQLSERTTTAYEDGREKVRRLVNAREASEIVFTRGTTEAINLVASSFGPTVVHAGDEILLTGLEHHSNIVPWQLLAERVGAKLAVVPTTDDGDVPLRDFADKMSRRTRMVAVAHVSNALGTVLPVAEITRIAHDHGVPVLIDGAQAAPHVPVDVQAIGCDFYTFSGHKTYGPTGVGVLYGRSALLERMPPYQGGGDMIRSVSFERTTYNAVPYKFEAGTPAIAEVIGLGAAIDYLDRVGFESIARHEADLLAYGTQLLERVPGLRLVGTAPHKVAILSFVLEGIHAHDVGTALDVEGIAVRTGHHCAQPVLDRFGLPATVRASLGLYNKGEDLAVLAEALHRIRDLFRGSSGSWKTANGGPS
jgi:cysteine desulfurase/selenocysteine lyase